MEYITGLFKEEFDRAVELKLKSAKTDYFHVKRRKPTDAELATLTAGFKEETADKFDKLAWKAEKATEQFEEEHFKKCNRRATYGATRQHQEKWCGDFRKEYINRWLADFENNFKRNHKRKIRSQELIFYPGYFTVHWFSNKWRPLASYFKDLGISQQPMKVIIRRRHPAHYCFGKLRHPIWRDETSLSDIEYAKQEALRLRLRYQMLPVGIPNDPFKSSYVSVKHDASIDSDMAEYLRTSETQITNRECLCN
ncbi:2644_t:CDS:2 [Paraglomus occultum]|uniref:2644_t:CDS:1 n=1 Tax=Paraglomus occultum TaxID=144539 RepID=A0A9N9FNZ9_9GLOM|nr:2644_t:CDS:2 [Paraglomus occultum]